MPFPYRFPIVFGELPGTQVLIGGVIPHIIKGSLSIDQRIEERGIAEFIIEDLEGVATYVKGEPVEIWNVTDTLAYSGFIETPEITRISPTGGLYHHIRCTDNHYLADKRLVVAAFAVPTDAGVIATALHTDYLAGEGVTVGSIQTGPEIPEAIFNYVTVAEALDILAEMAGFTWFIDEQKRFFFVDRTTYAAPWTAAIEDMTKRTPSLSTGNPLYRNRQYIRGGMGLTVLQTENRTGDGVTDVFIMSFPLAKEPDITEDGAPMDVGIRGLETGKDYYWSKGDNIIYAEVAPAGAVAIQFQYYGQYPLISLALDEGGRIARQAIEGGTGIIEDIIYEAHDSGVSSQESARAKLTDYCRDAARFRYQTTRSGIKPGQLQTINYPLLGLNNTEMLIESVRMVPYGNFIPYDITAIVGPVAGSWARLFSAMFRRQVAAIRIGDERLLALLQQLETLSLVEAPTSWQQLKGQYCWAVKTNGAGLRELRYSFGTWG